MPLLTLRNIELSYGSHPLLDGVDLSFEKGERVCLLGRNGAGKSTLMKILSDEIHADAGERVLQQGARVARLTQEVPEGLSGTVFEVVSGGLGELGELVRRYHELSLQLAQGGDGGGDDALLERLARVQHDLEAAGRERFTESSISSVIKTGFRRKWQRWNMTLTGIVLYLCCITLTVKKDIY